jgi:lysophospholipase L1-like esterase
MLSGAIGNESLSRRSDFLKQIVAVGSMTLGAPALVSAIPSALSFPNKEGDGYTFLFQGDSITDGNRSRNNDWNHVMGHGYAYLIASRLWYEFPKKEFSFFNRGVSGNKVTDLAARWQKDTLQMKLDLLSILVGINDTSVFVDGDLNYGAEQYKDGYRELLQQTKYSTGALRAVCPARWDSKRKMDSVFE